jgi:hypothetical protein
MDEAAQRGGPLSIQRVGMAMKCRKSPRTGAGLSLIEIFLKKLLVPGARKLLGRPRRSGPDYYRGAVTADTNRNP